MTNAKFLYVGTKNYFTNLEILKHNLKNLNINFEFEFTDCYPEKLNTHFDGIRLAEPFQNIAFQKKISKVNTLISRIGIVDFIYQKNLNWWPSLILKEALHLAIVHKHQNLSSRERALIIGVSIDSKIAFDVLVLMGFKSFTIVGESQEEANEFKSSVQTKYFSLDIEAISSDKVILLPGVHSIVVNTWNLNKKSDLLTDLLYFNYLKGKGLVLHFYSDDEKDPLISEANAIQEKTISRLDLLIFKEIAALRYIIDIDESKLKSLSIL